MLRTPATLLLLLAFVTCAASASAKSSSSMLSVLSESDELTEPVSPPKNEDPELFAEDFEDFWSFIDRYYAYLDDIAADWDQAHDIYAPLAANAPDEPAFIAVLERALGELYDHHAHLHTHTDRSPRAVPSGTDLWGAWDDSVIVITDVREDSHAAEAGLKPGMTVVAIDDTPVADAVQRVLPRTLTTDTAEAWNWATRQVLAGRHDSPVHLQMADRQVFAFTPGLQRPREPLSYEMREDGVGYIRVHNSLGEDALVSAFDNAMAELQDTPALILDLRDTPSGGNTTIARSLMGRLVHEETAYQRHEIPAEERLIGVRRFWVEYVAPRGPFQYSGQVIVLVGRWTGSMGGGIAIGLDGANRATVVGRPMAGLRGALASHTLPNTDIAVMIPSEKLSHVDGTPREAFVPTVLTEASDYASGEDLAIEAALQMLQR